ncbi:hypothetical protein [Sphingomonas sp. TREG-RG-20F-R18-01]|uniref:deoxynucleotide monophosphate kinase family protein n=1 Tax=Sphingomonas sp. TREG-RG-20F-R18-01 TaxID=2914982 RepID=UPI001F5A04A0|nr:hypothetical protein [Sphingomonas sp. TREG-RG-20F-R18-01]
MTRLIGLCSPVMGSGKSTVSEYLRTYRAEDNFEDVAFATALKEMAAGLLTGMGMEEMDVHRRIYGSRKEEVIPTLGITSRRLQQMLGTEFGRKMIREDLWMEISMANAADLMARGHSVVIDDVRFRNEYDAILAAGGTVYRVVRPSAKLTSEAHSSEGQLDGIAMPEIWNTGSLADLFAAVDRAVFA